MSEITDGGPAFPSPLYHEGEPGHESEVFCPGMSLRAYIATAIFASCEASEVFTEASGLELPARAIAAARAADALIAALKADA